MQKIKYEKGVTLVALVITIIVILILAGVTVNLSIDSVSSTRDRNLQSELEMIQQAIVTEYTKALELGNISETDVVPSNFIGEQITGIPTATLLDGATWYFSEHPTETPTGYKSYFRVKPEDLEELDILNSENTYIINYYTGEVYNETKKTNSGGTSSLYIRGNNANITSKDIDTTSFVE